jgi:glucose-6-phosphate isomerase
VNVATPRAVSEGGARGPRAGGPRAGASRGSDPHKVNPGSRPSTIVLFQQLDPVNLGRLIALYEHSVLAQSVVWGEVVTLDTGGGAVSRLGRLCSPCKDAT